jgi:hypothetical protein
VNVFTSAIARSLADASCIAVGRERARLDGLHHDDAHEQAALEHRGAEERVIQVLAGLREVLEARVSRGVGYHERRELLGRQAHQPFVQTHPHAAHARRIEADGGRQLEVPAIGVEQIDRADVALELLLDGACDVGERLGRIAAVRHHQAADLRPRA